MSAPIQRISRVSISFPFYLVAIFISLHPSKSTESSIESAEEEHPVKRAEVFPHNLVVLGIYIVALGCEIWKSSVMESVDFVVVVVVVVYVCDIVEKFAFYLVNKVLGGSATRLCDRAGFVEWDTLWKVGNDDEEVDGWALIYLESMI